MRPAYGWYVNLRMRRVEFVKAVVSMYNTADYGKYKGPKRTYMLHGSEVHPTEHDAMLSLCLQMRTRLEALKAGTRQMKLEAELTSCVAALEQLK